LLNINAQYNPVLDEAQELAKLICVPDNIWGDIPFKKSDTQSDSTIAECLHLVSRALGTFEGILKANKRKFTIINLVRMVCIKHEGLRVAGSLDHVLQAANIPLATNALSDDQALNSAMQRYISLLHPSPAVAKYDVSRNSEAMSGIEILAKKAGVAISFATAGKLLTLVEAESRSGLIELSKKHRKPPATQDAAIPSSMRVSVPMSAAAADLSTPVDTIVSPARQSDPIAKVVIDAEPSDVGHKPPRELDILCEIEIPQGLEGDRFVFVAKRLDGVLRIFQPLAVDTAVDRHLTLVA
jgi:hypothetical protein